MESTLVISADFSLLPVIEGCLRQEVRSQKTLYDKYKGQMFRIALRYADNREDAEDILQEGFLKIFRSMPDWKPVGSFEGWMKKIMVNTAIEALRRNKKFSLHTTLDFISETSEDLSVLDTLTGEEILQQIMSLPPGYRMVFNLFAIEGFSHAEIAQQLNISEGTSKSQYAKARRHLQISCEKFMHPTL